MKIRTENNFIGMATTNSDLINFIRNNLGNNDPEVKDFIKNLDTDALEGFSDTGEIYMPVKRLKVGA